ncbi:MAG: InlB B-repeat-containing protein, partial [Clostridia bacterium]|nr:InlB B-repeat-containing protein [Clostridia bacterium]
INGTGIIPTTAEHQKSTDGITWNDCTGEWTGLAAGNTYYVRVKPSGTVLASDAQSIEIIAFVPEQEQTPEAVFTATSADTGTLSNVTAGMKYKIDNGEWQTIAGTSVDLTNLSPCTITVYMPGNGTTTIDSDEQTITVTKAATPTLEATQPTVINGTGIIPTTAEHQKSTDGTTWEDCTGAWENLEANKTYYVRVKASGTVLASDAQGITINAFIPGKEQTPQAIFTATGADTGTLSNVAAGMKFKIDNGAWQTVTGTSVDLTNLAPCTITIYTLGNGTTTIDSDEQTITVTKAAAPTLTATQPTTINGTGSIPTTAEHQKSTNGTTWEDCTGAWENLEANKTYYVRVKAAGTVLASDAQEITINAFVPGKEQTPQAIFTATGSDTGTLSNVAAGMKYKIDNGEWQTIAGTSVDLTNLAPCTVKVYTPGNGTTTIDSDEQTITVTKAETPTLSATQPATINDKGVIPTMTAHEKSVNGTDWEECDGMWTDLDEGTYYVRVKAAGTVLTSDVQEIVIAVARYTVKFVDEDGTELQSTVYACGETPVYNGENPTKEATAENTYTFAGWTPDIVPVAGDATYTAKYDATVNEYTVTFETNGGSDVPAVKVKYGDPVAEPDAPEKKSFAFAGWYADEGLETPYDFTAKITADTKIYAKWTPISYPVFSGEDSEWTKGSDKDVVITVKRSDADDTCLDHFIGVEIDGNPLERDVDYTAAKGSVVITLKAATLEKLSVGEHTVTVIFDDGRVDTKLTIKAAPNNDPVSPQTGDNSHIGLWIALMVISFCGLSATLVIGKKKRVSGK